jgi:YD repeat-containing protein
MIPRTMNSSGLRASRGFGVALAFAVLASCVSSKVYGRDGGWDYGNGRHGSFLLTTNATIEQLYQTVRLANDLGQYDPTNTNAIPNFQSLIITNGATLTANPWNGSVGGVVTLKVQATLFIAAGSAISVSGIGFRGGGGSQQGESYTGSQASSTSANYGGGGGGLYYAAGPFVYDDSAGGGGYGSGGGNGSIGQGGGTYGTATISTLYLGSGGGGGVNGGPNGILGATLIGGNGGGGVQMQVGNLQVQGQIQANGSAGGTGAGGGGGGSGGSISLFVASAALGTNAITASGGGGGYSAGASGGIGRVAVGYAESYTGATTPTAYTFCDTNSDNVTVITNQPTTQTNVLGTNVTFNVGVYGLPTLYFQWNFNNVPIPGATNQLLLLPDIALTNTGNYSVTISNAVMTIVSSNAFLEVLSTAIPLNDGIPNWWKEEYGLSTNDPTLATNYPPADNQLTYLEKYLYGLNPLTNDTDGDGLTDYDEIFVYHTNPLSPNTAGDGIPDGWKVEYGLDPSINDANNQIGTTGITYWELYQYDLTHTNQLDPRNPFFAPGTSIYEAINNGQHTNKFYYDQEDRLVGMESSRGISIGFQYDGNGNLLRQSVLSRAAETNGLPVLWLWLNGLTNQPGITYANSSGNGWNNYQEWLAGLSPNSNSVPSLLNNPGTNIASLTLPFTPTNWFMAAGQLNGVAGDEIVVGADGNATGMTNSLFILTQGPSAWQVTQLPVGAMGITSIAVGQPTNRPLPAIYVGLRQTGGIGAIWELIRTNGAWQTSVLAVSTNSAAFVLGVRSTDVLGSFATNGLDGGLYSLVYTNGVWNQTVISTNGSHRGLGTHGQVFAQHAKDSSLRLLDAGGIEINGGNTELYTDGILLPQSLIQYSGTGKWHFATPTVMTFLGASNYFAVFHGKLSLPMSASENSWFSAKFPTPSWMGLYWGPQPGNTGWSEPYYGDGTAAPCTFWAGTYTATYNGPYMNWFQPDNYFWVGPCTVFNYGAASYWGCATGNNLYPGIGEPLDSVLIYTNQWLIPEPSTTNRFPFSGIALATGFPRPNQTSSSSVFYAFADDLNQSGKLDAGDDFSLAEFVVSGNTWTTNTLFQVPITAASVAQSFSLAAVSFTGTGEDTLFTGEPDGRVYSWTGNDNTNPLQRQLFSDACVGKAWQAMCGVEMPSFGKGLAGLMVDPTTQNTCNVIFWPPQPVLPTPMPSTIETAPYAAVIPSSSSLSSDSVVTVRLWDNEGDASTPFLQYQFLGSTNWQNATLTTLDGSPYSSAVRVAALPGGSDHFVTWNALADIGLNIATNILLRARAQDFMLTGDWSVPTPFQVNTLPPTTVSIGPPQLLPGGQFQFAISSGVLGQSYVVLASTNLVDWLPISGYIFTNPPITIFDSDATNFPWRFYRIAQ